jgi:hypothetical protein
VAARRLELAPSGSCRLDWTQDLLPGRQAP